MSEHDTANKIMDVITEYGRGMIDDDYEYIDSEDAVERIIAIVREAMLEAVKPDEPGLRLNGLQHFVMSGNLSSAGLGEPNAPRLLTIDDINNAFDEIDRAESTDG